MVPVDHLLNIVKEFKNLKKQVLQYIYLKIDKTCFTHDAAHSNSKDLAKGTISHKILKYRANGIARNCRYDKYQRAWASMVYKFFDEKTGSGVSVHEKTSSKIT